MDSSSAPTNHALVFDKVSYQVRLADRVLSLLHDVSFTIPSRSLTTVVGPNGAGKSTLIKLAVGEISSSSGHIARPQSQRIGYVPQSFEIPASLPISAGEFLSLNMNAISYKKSTQSLSKHTQQTLERVGFHRALNTPLQACSGGERQRLLLARAILRQPGLLILDEPLQGVDLAGQSALYQLIADLRRELDCAVLMVSHDLHFVMADTDHVICLNGHICCEGHPETVNDHPEYQKLLEGSQTSTIGVYTHHHDHHHGYTAQSKKEGLKPEPSHDCHDHH